MTTASPSTPGVTPPSGDSLAEGVKTPRAGERTPLSNGQTTPGDRGQPPASERSGGPTSPPAG